MGENEVSCCTHNVCFIYFRAHSEFSYLVTLTGSLIYRPLISKDRLLQGLIWEKCIYNYTWLSLTCIYLFSYRTVFQVNYIIVTFNNVYVCLGPREPQHHWSNWVNINLMLPYSVCWHDFHLLMVGRDGRWTCQKVSALPYKLPGRPSEVFHVCPMHKGILRNMYNSTWRHH